MLVGAHAQAAPQRLVISAASSLSDAMVEIGQAFERAEPNRRVLFNFAASTLLLNQLERGADIDVLATADVDTMDRAQAERLIEPASRTPFAANDLVLITPRTGPTPIRLQDLLQPEFKRLGIGNPATVPAGRYAEQVLAQEGLSDLLRPRWVRAENVRQVLQSVALGEVDAGFVYKTDALRELRRVNTVMTLTQHAPVVYPVAQVRSSKQPFLARQFIAFLQSPFSQAVLKRHGFDTI
jgi:molybdate transport system substrate-binding protein